jgi:hypothetical protein
MIAVELVSLTDPAEAVVVSASKVAPEIAAIAFHAHLPSTYSTGVPYRSIVPEFQNWSLQF